MTRKFCLLYTFLEGKLAANFSFFSLDTMDFQGILIDYGVIMARYE